MKFDSVIIKDICKIKSGKRLPLGYDFSETKTQHPYIRARDIKNGIIYTENLAYISDDVYNIIKKYIIKTGDIAITIVGASVGNVGYASEQVDGFNLTENAVRLTDFREDINPRYVFYFLNSTQGQSILKKLAGGAAQPKLGIYKVESIPINIPRRECQDRIASILSAYDNLIENNQKQIKLLEEAAQRLYKEWFVDLRFPGHESVRVVDGVPEGWERSCVKNVSSILRRGISPHYDENGKYLVINQKCIRSSIIDINEARKQSKEYSKELEIQDSDTLICSTGTGTLGRVGQVFGYFPNTTFDSHVTVVRSNSKIGKQYLYHSIKSKQGFLMGMGRGSTNQQELYKPVIENLEITVPPIRIVEEFELLAQDIHDKITALVKTIELLQQSRDRLLPKLMSGELEV